MFPSLPACVRLVLTSRPEAHIRALLDARFRPRTIAHDDPRHLADLRAMVTASLGRGCMARPEEVAPATDLLLGRSGGTFVYVARALAAIEQRRTPWTLSELSGLPDGMDQFSCAVF